MRRLVLALVVAGCAEPASPTRLASPEPIEVDVTEPDVTDADLSDEGCLRCHVDEAHAWEASAHRTAFTDEVFQAEWAAHEQPECVRCHAPLADPDAPEGDAAANGVSCAVCHVREGSVLAGSAAPDAPHPITIEPALHTSEACAGCHEFTFASVAPTSYDEAGILQGTLTEWHTVEERGTCQRCHMREGSHAMPGARDATLLSRALTVEGEAHVVGDHVEVALVLTSRAGHAVPTGDMYRRLEVSAWTTREADAVSSTLMRRFDRVDGVLREVSDDRVPARGERRVTLSLPRPRATEVHWRVRFQALDPVLARARWIPDEDAARVVAEGTLTIQ